MIVDFIVVGLAINRSLEMFSSLLGTWIPFAMIFASTWLTGRRNTSGSAADEATPSASRVAA
jgi:hypothetical protein